MSHKALLPCPFCGNADGKEPERYGVYVWLERRWRGQFSKGSFVAECRNCGVDTGPCSSEAEAIAGWNTRRDPVQKGLIEALKACQLQMLQSNNDSEYAQEANELARAALLAAGIEAP
jgi:hypothetical protein